MPRSTRRAAGGLLLTLALLAPGATAVGAGPIGAASAVTTTSDASSLDLSRERGIWLDDATLAVDAPVSALQEGSVEMHLSSEGSVHVDGGEVSGAEKVITLGSPAPMGEDLAAAHPRYADYAAVRVPERVQVRKALRGQVALVVRNAAGELIQAAGVQIGPVLDDVYSAAVEAEIGLTWTKEKPKLSLWAPTAQSVEVELRESPEAEPTRHRMRRDPRTGVWSITGKPDWDRQYYTYRVTVWHPDTQAVETTSVTDPSSVSLAADSQASQIVDLDDAALQPEGWEQHEEPAAVESSAAQIWEVQVRDFSIADATIPGELRGTYAAFTESDSTSVRHLRDLAEAGLTHVHLQPTFDIATIPEADQARPDCDLASFGQASPAQQECVGAVRGEDAYNWGYDPLHFNAPEGSYATDPDGPARILEYRRMVQALHEMGLKVVTDVVYNHTAAAGMAQDSVLDRIVPGYYHRLNETGAVETSTCCANTAPERAMYDKFIVESAALWAEAYDIDGMRVDLMGHHPKANILGMQDAVEAVDEDFLLYGEGWNFGEVADDALFEQATQENMAGTGVGTFDDRLRDAARGGGPFDADPRRQGFGSGLWCDPNGAGLSGTGADQRATLGHASDLVRLGLVGSLADYPLTTADGREVTGAEVDYNGRPAGYTAQPGEAVTYVDAHDNEILFDALAYKLPHDVGAVDRARQQAVNLSLATLSQGSGLITAGSEMLRSKSLDRDSYDSGDWFNAIRWTCEDPASAGGAFGDSTTGFDNGLPPAWTSRDKWSYAEDTLEAVETPDCAAVELGDALYQELLRIADSTRAFSLGDAEQVVERVDFPTAGEQAPDGVITMTVDLQGLDDAYEQVTVVFNPTPETAEPTVAAHAGTAMRLHPVQRESADERLREASFDASDGSYAVPARSTAVFVEPRR